MKLHALYAGAAISSVLLAPNVYAAPTTPRNKPPAASKQTAPDPDHAKSDAVMQAAAAAAGRDADPTLNGTAKDRGLAENPSLKR